MSLKYEPSSEPIHISVIMVGGQSHMKPTEVRKKKKEAQVWKAHKNKQRWQASRPSPKVVKSTSHPKVVKSTSQQRWLGAAADAGARAELATT